MKTFYRVIGVVSFFALLAPFFVGSIMLAIK